ncbi:hypothetical protein [Streptomyces silaceus]|uniref:hypothetical protein n=1 Tax=Streptomyces silaceus TaxID=545123 RepID=UPI0012FF33E8|nr:hypothetical protein [Streptomyces silaceus]
MGDTTAAQPGWAYSTALTGTYLFASWGLSVSATSSQPLAFAGSERCDGSGPRKGISPPSLNGTITRDSSFTGTRTIAKNCTGTLTVGASLHFDLYIAPSGDSFAYVQTDPGSVSATTEQRATRV